MILFIYDHTFEGLLTCIFDAYFRKTFPDSLLMEGEPLPLFYDEAIHIATVFAFPIRVLTFVFVLCPRTGNPFL